MKSKLLSLIIVIFLLIIIFSGCSEKKETAVYSLNSLSLKVDDLPSGYIKWSEVSNYSDYSHQETITGIKPSEFYFTTFVFNETEINTVYPAIALNIFRFSTSNDAEVVMLNLSENMIKSLNASLNRTTPQDVPQVGNQSIYELFQGNMGEYYGYQNATWSIIYFIIENITVSLLLEGQMNSNINYVELTLNYAKIIENRINILSD
ncbi:MAG: hypothetical protein NT038_00450 [Euryarchaeota archaeon]|nr:hypothetical protein [Euryarchaeota archaeon]